MEEKTLVFLSTQIAGNDFGFGADYLGIMHIGARLRILMKEASKTAAEMKQTIGLESLTIEGHNIFFLSAQEEWACQYAEMLTDIDGVESYMVEDEKILPIGNTHKMRHYLRFFADGTFIVISERPSLAGTETYQSAGDCMLVSEVLDA